MVVYLLSAVKRAFSHHRKLMRVVLNSLRLLLFFENFCLEGTVTFSLSMVCYFLDPWTLKLYPESAYRSTDNGSIAGACLVYFETNDRLITCQLTVEKIQSRTPSWHQMSVP